MIDEFFTAPSTPSNKHLILVLCTRTPLKTRFTISRLRAHLRVQVDYSAFAKKQREKAKAEGNEYKWEDMANRVHFLGVEVDLCDLQSVYALADRLVNGTVGSPDATTMDGQKLPHGSPGTASYSANIEQDRWALSEKRGSIGAQRSWGWGLSGIRLPRLDVVILSAGIGGWKGVDYFKGTRDVIFNTIQAVTWPEFNIGTLGDIVKPQLSLKGNNASDEARQPLHGAQEKDEAFLGKVFCSNVFGHYILAHELMPLLSRPANPSTNTGGKIIWVSSITTLPGDFSFDDFQCLKEPRAYESSKCLIDILALTSALPSTRRATAPFFDPSNTTTAAKNTEKEDGKETLVRPSIYLTHPGVFASEIMPMNFIFVAIYKFIFLVARWLGSPWHPIESYKAAVAPVWLSLIGNDELEEMEDHGAKKCKYGSATDTKGVERVMKTEVPGWGWNGQVETVDDELRKGRRVDAVDVTKESREDFEVLGVKCWTQMEELREEWEEILGVKSGKDE